MGTVEIALFVASLLAIVFVFVAEVPRGRRPASITLPPAMLFAFRILLGIVLTILGVIGSLLPVMQGWLFFLLAALVLFPQSRFAVKALDKAAPRMPRVVAWLRRYGIGVRPERDETIAAE